MQVLPLRDEVREARERATYAERAMILSQQVGIALTAVSIVDRQLRQMEGEHEVELPGGDIVDQAVATYPELAGLADIAPDPEAPPSRQLEQRRLQLRTIDQFIRPIAATHEELSTHVHALQHEQAQILQRPEYAELKTGLDSRNAVRTRSTITLSRLRARRQSLLPAEQAVRQFVPLAEAELAAASEGFNRELARNRLLTIVQTLDMAGRSLGLEVNLPDPATLEREDCSDEDLAEAVVALNRLGDAAEAEAELLEAEIARVQAEIDEATAWMIERTG